MDLLFVLRKFQGWQRAGEVFICRKLAENARFTLRALGLIFLRHHGPALRPVLIRAR